MEEYVRDAPAMKEKVVLAIEYKKEPEEEEKPTSPPPAPEPEPEQEPEPEPEPVKEEAPAAEPTDLLGLNETNPAAAELEEKNALALAIVPIDDAPRGAPTLMENGVTGWELALVTAPSSNETAVTSSKKLAGGLDLLTLDSLYDDANRRASQPTSYNPWEVTPATAATPIMQQPAAMHHPFYGSNGYAAPHAVQMAAMAQQQQAFMLQQQMMMASHPQVVHHQAQAAPANPFGANPFAPAGAHHPYGGGAGMMPLHAGTGNAYTGLI
jgi:hypothetical protein